MTMVVTRGVIRVPARAQGPARTQEGTIGAGDCSTATRETTTTRWTQAALSRRRRSTMLDLLDHYPDHSDHQHLDQRDHQHPDHLDHLDQGGQDMCVWPEEKRLFARLVVTCLSYFPNAQKIAICDFCKILQI